MIFLTLVLGIGLSLSPPSPYPGQGFQNTLEQAAAAFAEAWTEKDVLGLREHMSEKGIRLHLPDEDHLLIRPRQAQAALKEFLNRYGAGETVISMVSLAGDDGQTGFAEMSWQAAPSGLPEAVTFTVFLGFALTEEGWTVTEIRVLL